jgi:hypothetical protein
VPGELRGIEPRALAMGLDDQGDRLSRADPMIRDPPLLSGRNSGPSVMPAADSHAFKVSTGQATDPRTIAMVCPSASWSILLSRIVIRSPSRGLLQVGDIGRTSSERRKAQQSRSGAIYGEVRTGHTKKRPGRPATGKDPMVTARMPPEMIQSIEAWAAYNGGAARSAAIRRLVELGLKAGK